MNVGAFFHDLGVRIQRAWIAASCSEDRFPEIAAAELDRTAPARHVDVGALLAWGLGTHRLPEQLDARSEFGEPPLTVFSEDRFFISVLFWRDGTTDIHEHGFDGAFHVLRGGSLHTAFDFSPERSINQHMLLGKLTERRPERLKRGDTREIRRGAALIHQLFHLERPSATVVVRTRSASTRRPQFSYWRSGVACDTKYDFTEQKRRRDLLHLAHDVHPAAFEERCLRWLEVADFVGACLGLRHCAGLLSPEEGDALLARARISRPDVVAVIQQVLENDRREMSIVHKRRVVRDVELRFFLALLLNIRGRDNVLRMIAEEYPKRDPAECVVGWMRALGRLPAAPGAASVLGFELDDVVSAAIHGLFSGRSARDVATHVPARGRKKATAADMARMADLCAALEQSELLRLALG